MKQSIIWLTLIIIVGACAGSDTAADVPGAPPSEVERVAGQAGNAGTRAATSPSPGPSAVTTTAPASTFATTSTTAPPAPAPTSAPTPAPTPAPTAPPTTTLQFAECVQGEINLFTTGRRSEIALYQQTLKDLGYDPGEVDGFFGQNSITAATAEILDNGNVNGPNGVFEELFPDDGAVLPPAFERLGIGCV